MDAKKIAFVSLLIFGITAFSRMYANSKPGKFNLNGNSGIRKCDAFGCGHFGASRGSRKHNGVDILTAENQEIKAPFDCKITRYGYPYANDLSYQLVEIQGLNAMSHFKAKLMYIKTLHPVGTALNKGDLLCAADNIAKKYGPGMGNHVHFELYQNGKLIDPTPYL